MLWEEQQKQDHILMEESKSNSRETCPDCKGSGVVGDGLCSSCNGTGVI